MGFNSAFKGLKYLFVTYVVVCVVFGQVSKNIIGLLAKSDGIPDFRIFARGNWRANCLNCCPICKDGTQLSNHENLHQLYSHQIQCTNHKSPLPLYPSPSHPAKNEFGLVSCLISKTYINISVHPCQGIPSGIFLILPDRIFYAFQITPKHGTNPITLTFLDCVHK